MAISSNLVKEWYKNLSVEELEKKYKELEKDYYFDTKEKQIEYYLKNFMNASHDTNLNATRAGLEELLKEKTGKDYHLKTQFFEVNLNDILDYIVKTTDLISNKEKIADFFSSLDEMDMGDEKFDEMQKMWLLMCLYQNKQNFTNFEKELNEGKDNLEIFKKYLEICEDYYSNYSMIG